MHFRPGDVLAGIPVELARKVAIAQTATRGYAAFSAEWIAKRAKLSPSEIVPILQRFEQEGFAEHAGDGYWRQTDDGRTLSKAIIGEPLTREEAQAQLDRFLDEVRAVNDDSTMPRYVRAVEIYGSLIRTDAHEIGDVDVVVSLDKRYDDLTDQERALGIRRLPDDRRPSPPLYLATGRLPYISTIAASIVTIRLRHTPGATGHRFLRAGHNRLPPDRSDYRRGPHLHRPRAMLRSPPGGVLGPSAPPRCTLR